MRQALDHLHHLGFGDLQAYGLLARTLANQSYLLAADDLFWLSGCLSVALIGVVWMAKRAGAPRGRCRRNNAIETASDRI